ncbi:MAG: FIST C-terminal domain-containing protein [Burkholderiales bacterium]
MTRFRSAHSGAQDWRRAVQECAASIGVAPGLGFVYFSDAFADHAEGIVQSLRELTGVRHWVGTVGIGVLASGVEYYDEPALSVMVAGLDESSYQVFSGRSRPRPDAHFAVVHGDPETHGMPGLVADMSTKLASGFLVGGLSSSRARTVQVADDVISGGLSGAVFGAEVAVSTRLTQGCSPLPGRYRITQCEQNVLVTLDGRPALEVFKAAIGDVLSRDLNRAVHFIHAGLPVRGSDRGDYLVRNVVGIDPKNGLVAIGDLVEPGDELVFCKRDAESARRDLGRILDELRIAVPQPRGALYYSCLGRGEHMFGRRGAEIEQVRDALGDVPLTGFFCNGEISHDRLYGYTGVLTLFH